jgi:hypothetical protein
MLLFAQSQIDRKYNTSSPIYLEGVCLNKLMTEVQMLLKRKTSPEGMSDRIV